ncbi:hypothetical protein HBI79_078880 [Parastagonospora nodorum]|nr:hypothetical protein HBI79_078880 [Parastagonospora nodorum]
MDSTYQEWYEPFAEDHDEIYGASERDVNRAGQQRDQNTNSDTASRYLDFNLASNTLTMPDLPPSLLAATENYPTVPSYDPVIYDSFANALAEDDEVYNRAAASIPFSFHHRSLQSPHIPNGLDMWMDESFSEGSPSQRIDSAMGSVDGLSELADPVFAEDCKVDAGEPSRSLQCHLIQMKSRAELKETTLPSPSSSEDNRTLSCHLCPEKQYTGTWAHRNLSRHMETTHAPCPAPDGVKQIRCSHVKCEKTFNRKDARLVHERKSHPDLNRSPPMKRKRSEDL